LLMHIFYFILIFLTKMQQQNAEKQEFKEKEIKAQHNGRKHIFSLPMPVNITNG